jgi:hypothetical protein
MFLSVLHSSLLLFSAITLSFSNSLIFFSF